MSRGPPPQSTANLFGFGPHLGADSLDPMGTDPSGLMSMHDSSMFADFDDLPMNLNLDDATVSQSFPGISASTPQALANALEQAGDPVFGSEETRKNLKNPSPMPTIGSVALSYTSGPSSGNGSNILTEFTKRRNWPAKVVEELQDVLQILDADGKIKFVSPSILALTGYKAEDILNKFYQQLIHSDDAGVFTAELNESIATGNPLRLFYRFKKRDDSYIIFESVGHAHIAAAKFAPNPNNQSPFCQAVFMMSRPYPTKNTSLLDSFLEHKIENERLRRRIAELKREEADEAEESQRTWRQSHEGRSDIAPSEDTTVTGATPLHVVTSPDVSVMPPPERPASLNIALTRENLEGILGSRPDSIKEKMARYEGASHADTIEMLTGLRYLEGERSRGITTGNASPTLIKGDAGIAIPMDRDPRTGEKKKKLKVAEEYVCTDCGTLDSPEWRKGPSGPKTLCNACGLRWAKKEKKKNNSFGKNGGASGGLAESAA